MSSDCTTHFVYLQPLELLRPVYSLELSMYSRCTTEDMSAAGALPFSSAVLHSQALSAVFSRMRSAKWTALADARVGSGV